MMITLLFLTIQYLTTIRRKSCKSCIICCFGKLACGTKYVQRSNLRFVDLSLRSCWLLFSYISPVLLLYVRGLSQRLSKDMQKWSTAQIFVTPKLGSHDSWVTPKLILNYSAALVVMQLTPYLSHRIAIHTTLKLTMTRIPPL
jgi:hypothetical protein